VPQNRLLTHPLSPGRPRKLTRRQEGTVLGWLTKSPRAFGFAGELWTSRRLAALIERRWGVCFNANYLVEWLSARRHSAQKPEPRAKEQDEAAVACWLAEDWRRTGLYFHADAKHYIAAQTMVAFLREVLGHLRGRVIVVWDGGSNHKGPLIRQLLARYPRLHLEPLPAYAPQLNPVEFIWSYL